MSYPADERDTAPIPSGTRNPVTPAAEKDKTQDKPKPPLQVQPGGLQGEAGPRTAMDMASAMKAGKAPVPNRPIAPAAAASNVLTMGSHIGSGYMSGFGLGSNLQGHPMVNSPIPLPASMLQRGPVPTHHTFSHHVPMGAAAAALAGAPPRSTSLSSLRSVPKPGITAHHPSPVSMAQAGHLSVSGAASASATPPVSTASAAMPTYYQQSSDHKQSELRDGRSPLVPDLMRRTGSPHGPISSQAPSSLALSGHTPTTAKIGFPGTVPHPGIATTSHKPAQAMMIPHFSQTHSPLHVPTASINQSAVAATLPMPSISGSPAGIPVGLQQAKVVPAAASVAPGAAKMFAHMNFPVSKPESSGPTSDMARLGNKPSGKASPITAPQHITSSSVIATTAHVLTASPAIHSSIMSDGRLERAHQPVALTSQMYGHPGIARPYIFPNFPDFHGYPIHIPHGHPSHPATTAGGQVAAGTATVMNPALIMDQSRYLALAQQAAAAGAFGGFSASSMASDVSGSSGMIDSSITNPGLYSMSMLSMQQGAANLQVPISSSNPNATSPRPSILRKRTSEGLRKPTVVPYNDGMSSSFNQVERAASPRSDTTTLSAPQSAQSSPKPSSSDSGSQETTTAVPPAPPPVPTQEPAKVPAADTTAQAAVIKKEPSDSSAPSASAAPLPASTVATPMMAGPAAAPVGSTATDKPAVSLPDGASPRKKPRKQNVIVTEDKYGSSVPIEEASSDDEEKKGKQQQQPPLDDPSALDDDLKFILLKRPKVSIFGGYKVNTKAAHNHFLRYTDVKLKERKPTIQDLANQKTVVNRVSGWRVQHIAAQMDELNNVEQEVLKRLFELREKLPKPRPGQKSKHQDELCMLDELVQGNIQRSQLVSEQLCDSRKSMVKVLEHRPRCVDILQKYINKRNPKKKS